MTLTDAGPLVALIDRGEPDHRKCREAVARLRGPLLSTWPAFTEAVYLLGEAGGWPAQEALWRVWRRGDLRLQMPQQATRIPALMEKYRDLPMDLADASLVAMAEELAMHTIFSLDRDFLVYRLPGGKRFRIIP